ncbi:MAG: aminoacyl-tRNA deacylase [Actinomycetaceae bacterium]|nr:aminoacyl-tRNA deacylase [Actinomycetaceae bacterium]
MEQSQSGATPALTYLIERGIACEELTYEHTDGFEGGFGVEAAAKLGASTDDVFKTLMLEADSRAVAVLIPASHRLSLKKVARSIGAKRAELMDPKKAQQRSGYVVGGISPFGQKQPHELVVDEGVLALTHMIVSGGRRGLSLRMKVTDFLDVSRATVADIVAQ